MTLGKVSYNPETAPENGNVCIAGPSGTAQGSALIHDAELQMWPGYACDHIVVSFLKQFVSITARCALCCSTKRHIHLEEWAITADEGAPKGSRNSTFRGEYAHVLIPVHSGFDG